MGTGSPDDYYALLGVDAEIDDTELRRVWRRLALQWHPDRAGPGATTQFQRILAAYTVLADPGARAAYDRRRGTPRRPPAVRPEPATAAPPVGPRRRAPGVMLRRLSRSLDVLLACRIARWVDSEVIELFLEPDEIAEGGMVTISMRVPVHCAACAADATSACVACGSTRIVEDLFSAWLAVPPGVVDGAILVPSARLPGMVSPVSFRVRTG